MLGLPHASAFCARPPQGGRFVVRALRRVSEASARALHEPVPPQTVAAGFARADAAVGGGSVVLRNRACTSVRPRPLLVEARTLCGRTQPKAFGRSPMHRPVPVGASGKGGARSHVSATVCGEPFGPGAMRRFRPFGQAITPTNLVCRGLCRCKLCGQNASWPPSSCCCP